MRVKYTLLKLSLTSVLGMALLVGACAEQGTQPEQISAPSEADFARGGVKKKQFRRLNLSNPAPMHVSAEVGARGGILQADRYFLLVPAGAVKEKTTFTMDVGTDGVVQLEATVSRGNGVRQDVGTTGFAKKLTLALYYGQSPDGLANEAELRVAQLLDNGAFSAVPSAVNTEYKVVHGQLSHFSTYLLMEPKDEDE